MADLSCLAWNHNDKVEHGIRYLAATGSNQQPRLVDHLNRPILRTPVMPTAKPVKRTEQTIFEDKSSLSIGQSVLGLGRRRLKALTDGIFAAVMTVLVLTLNVPPVMVCL